MKPSVKYICYGDSVNLTNYAKQVSDKMLVNIVAEESSRETNIKV